MAKTEEGKVKDIVRTLLNQYGAYYFQPVQMGYGPSGLDFHGVYKGHAYFVETKKLGGELTPRQVNLIKTLREKHKAAVFVISGYGTELRALERWLQSIQEMSISKQPTFKLLREG